ncbi:hypothetical protein EV191_10536 [Tamaricihabitans halophyticus]|uniref:HTH luxR-type domain-containing protein n=1 Tax=Tamaricihabitans halophyticus TaxID=1262583 RepID=A0A4R2R0P0_9PSEU|nr:hypothetical protein EV191_10536 [Tamaricihabitans halophyticus]
MVHGAEELFARAGHLFVGTTELACAANDLYTWVATQPRHVPPELHPRSMRKLYRPGVLLQPSSTQHLRTVAARGTAVRISQDDINETIILDDRAVILAGAGHGADRNYSVITQPDTIAGVRSLFEAAWRASTELAVCDAQLAELRTLAPRILELLGAGHKDETAARNLGLSLRTYRRRVADVMRALGATSRFQAGVRARELGVL